MTTDTSLNGQDAEREGYGVDWGIGRGQENHPEAREG